MAAGTPDRTLLQIANGSIDFANDTIKILLLDDSTTYTFDSAAHEFVDDLDGSSDGDDPSFEMNGTGYTRKTLSNQSTTEDNTDNEAEFDGDDITWSGLDAGDIQTVVVYKQVGGDDTTPGDDPVLAVFDDDSAYTVSDLPLTTNGSDVTLAWASEGILNFISQ